MPEKRNQEEESVLSPGITRWVRYFFASIGILASVLGLIMVIAVYLVVSPQIDITRGMLLGQVDNAISGVGHLDKSLEGAQESLGKVPEMSENLSSGFESYASSTFVLADGIDAIANEMAVLYGQDKTASLKSAASNLRSSASALEVQSESISSVSSSLETSIKGIGDARKDLSKAKSDLSKAKTEVSGVFDSLSTALILACVLFALVFISLGAYSVALFL